MRALENGVISGITEGLSYSYLGCMATLLFLFLRNYSLAAAGERISSAVSGSPTPCRPSNLLDWPKLSLGPSTVLGLLLL